MTPTGPDTEAHPDRAPAGVTPNVIDIVEALQRSLLPHVAIEHDDHASMAEIESILSRMDRELAVEEALTRQLMARQGI